MGRKLTSALALTLTFGAAAAWADCKWATGDSHSDYRACLEREVVQSNAQVDAEVEIARHRISSADEDTPPKQQALEALRVAYDSFKRYRTHQCEYEASTAAGGNSAGDLRALCEIALDKAYIEHMKSVHGFGGS